jgi:hypothetical protein
MLKKTVREPTVAGACITLGLVVRETDQCISYRDRHGTQKIISKRWAVHTEPCPSCPDYPEDEVSMVVNTPALRRAATSRPVPPNADDGRSFRSARRKPRA